MLRPKYPILALNIFKIYTIPSIDETFILEAGTLHITFLLFLRKLLEFSSNFELNYTANSYNNYLPRANYCKDWARLFV